MSDETRARDRRQIIAGLPCLLAGCARKAATRTGTTAPPAPDPPPPPWKEILRQQPEFYGSAQALRLAQTVIRNQGSDGGWPKNTDLTAEAIRGPSTLDNGATVTPLRFLARVAAATGRAEPTGAFTRGLDALLGLQYPNGGWPQSFQPRGYQAHITFNDDAMVNVLRLLSEVARRQTGVAFVDERRARRCQEAVARGIDCILRTQIVERRARTAWCAQHDRETMAPAKARAYEHPSKSGGESAGIVLFLMDQPAPASAVVEAVQAAVSWLERVKITGHEVVDENGDRVLRPNPSGPPLWARFYELDTDRPIFSGRDGVIRYALADIERERRAGYAWYVTAPRKALTRYKGWRAG